MLSWQSQEIKNSISSGSTPQALILFFVIGMVLLTQACFNYVNITLATGSRRLKEIGIRKVSGGQRSQLVAQFLSENVLLCFSALIVGLLLTEFLFLPGMIQMTGSNQHISLLDFFSSAHIWIFFVIVLLLTGLGAGLYPALIISRLQPTSIFKNKFGIGGKKRFTRLLLSFQFGIAFLIICLVTTFWRNNQYQRGQDWGYNQQHVINIELESPEPFEVLRNRITQNSNVIEMAGTVNTIGRTEQQAVVEVEALKHEVVRLDVGPGYLKTLGIRLDQGRLFDPDLRTDRDAAIVVNELFVHQMGWTNAVGQSVRFDNRVYRVIGVVKDFHYDDFFHDIKSVMIRLAPHDQYRYLAVRVQAGTGVQSVGAFEESWQALFPDAPFSAFFQDGVFDYAFRNNEGITRIFAAAATITLIISCMGLFGLVTLMIAKRMKEISIHKVLGASVSQVANLVSRRFVILVLASTALAVPVGYVLLQNLLDAVYPYHMPLGLAPFVLAVSIVLLTAVLTIASQVYKATVRNPIDALRYE
jgi:ABC-type antimicrobial peptide transport system permease subunit